MKVVILDGGALAENVELLAFPGRDINDSIVAQDLCNRICAAVERFSKPYTQAGEEC